MQDLQDEAIMPMQELLDRYGGGAHQKSISALKKAGLKLQSPMLQSKKGAKDGDCAENGEKDDVIKNISGEISNGHCKTDSDSDDVKSENDTENKSDKNNDNAKSKDITESGYSKSETEEKSDVKTESPKKSTSPSKSGKKTTVEKNIFINTSDILVFLVLTA